MPEKRYVDSHLRDFELFMKITQKPRKTSIFSPKIHQLTLSHPVEGISIYGRYKAFNLTGNQNIGTQIKNLSVKHGFKRKTQFIFNSCIKKCFLKI